MTKYLIVAPTWVGDMVMAQSLFITLQQRDPDAVIDVIAPDWSLPVVARMPQIRNAIPLALKRGQWGFFARRRLGLSLRAKGYNKAIVLPRTWKSALVPFFANIATRVGFFGEQRYGLLTEYRRLDRQVLNQTVKRFVSLGLPSHEAYPPASTPYPVLSIDAHNQARLYQHFGLPGSPGVAIMPGVEYGPAKQWPLSYYRQLTMHLLRKGYQVWVLGAQGDYQEGQTITQQLNGPVFNLCGKTSLVDVVDLVAKAQFAVCNDSGLMHIAAAVNTPVHALYGSSDPIYTPPLSARATVHSLNLDCSPCFARQCRYGHYNCLRQLTPSKLIDTLPARR